MSKNIEADLAASEQRYKDARASLALREGDIKRLDAALAETRKDLAAAERARDEVGIQLAACRERLRLATRAVANARTLVAMWMQETPQLSHYMLDLNASLTALDAVPGDALAKAGTVNPDYRK